MKTTLRLLSLTALLAGVTARAPAGSVLVVEGPINLAVTQFMVLQGRPPLQTELYPTGQPGHVRLVTRLPSQRPPRRP